MIKINIIGSGYMGKQIASLFKVLGFEVFLWHNNNIETLNSQLEIEVKKLEKYFKINSTGSIKITNQLKDLKQNFTIETVKEDINIKKKFFLL